MAARKPRLGDRPFRLVDAMILTAATAVGLAGVMGLREGLNIQVVATRLRAGWDYLILAESDFAVFGSPLLAAWSAAVIPIRLISPRPSRGRAGVQPGMTAACATVLALAGAFVVCIPTPPCQPFEVLLTWITAAPGIVSLAILASWTTLALGRRWRPDPGWIDRLGRFLALAWFAHWLAVLHLLHFV